MSNKRKKVVKISRKDILPKRSDIVFIMKHFNMMPFQDIRRTLNVTNHRLIQWVKLIYNTDEKERKWREIEANLNFLEMHESFNDEMASDYDIHDIKQIGGKQVYVIKRKIVNDNRMFYMVTLNHDFHYMVKFDISVDRNDITYTNHTMGCDYEVHPVGLWEYQELREHLPVVEITADEDYVGNFWLAMSNMLIDETRRK
jgi:hypothetical protein